MSISLNLNPAALLGAGQTRGASPGAAPATTGSPPASTTSAMQDFLDFMKMTPAQQMRAAILGQMGLKEADLKNMDPKKRQEIEAKIKEEIKAQVQKDTEKRTGMIVDLKA